MKVDYFLLFHKPKHRAHFEIGYGPMDFGMAAGMYLGFSLVFFNAWFCLYWRVK